MKIHYDWSLLTVRAQPFVRMKDDDEVEILMEFNWEKRMQL